MNNIGHCYEGCEYSHGAPPQPTFPTANATVCGCQSWGKVSCSEKAPNPRPPNWQPKTNLWPCDPIHHPGSEFYYCEDGPGWKPPAALIQREAEEQTQLAELKAQLSDGLISADVAARLSLGLPRPAANVFEMLWVAAPVSVGSEKGTVELDLSGLGERTDLQAVRYAWPLGGDGDTCCPGQDAQSGFSVCTPAACPILGAKSQLPANPFFATVANGKCACEKPQVCDE
jgi:hypothetical protein